MVLELVDRLWLFRRGRPVRGFCSRKTLGKVPGRGVLWLEEIEFPESREGGSTFIRISRTLFVCTLRERPAGIPWADTVQGPGVSHLPCGVFFEIDSSGLLEPLFLSYSPVRATMAVLLDPAQQIYWPRESDNCTTFLPDPERKTRRSKKRDRRNGINWVTA